MTKKILIILLFAVFVGARHAVPLQGLVFAQAPQTECPPEYVTDSLEIITYYPSPYGYCEELRGDKIIVGDTDNSRINETDLPPSGTITFEPLSGDPSGNLYEGSLYYQEAIGGTKGKFRFYDGTDWQDLGGGGDSLLDGVVVCSVNKACPKGWLDWKTYNLAKGDLSTADDMLCAKSSLTACVKDTSLSPGIIVSGTNPTCPAGHSPVYRKWLSQSCGSSGNSCCGRTFPCSTSNAWIAWSAPASSCIFFDFFTQKNCGSCGLLCMDCCCGTKTCTSPGWSDVYCSKS